MKRFRFSLQSVHNLRLTLRECAERELAEKECAVAEAIERLADIQRKQAEATRAYTELMRTGEPKAHEIAICAAYIARLEQQEREARARLAQLERERDLARQKVIEAAQAAETTEKLRERQYAQHRSEVLRLEQQLLDEIATLSVARQLTR
ncbi:MAG: flagellar export protein FliJ [Pyrinomonas methylaliphatogenes]|jgi:flagellar export protein FliJ|nr:flagellar export protein FliJ [Pyrinomonas methylaliphatogenes]